MGKRERERQKTRERARVNENVGKIVQNKLQLDETRYLEMESETVGFVELDSRNILFSRIRGKNHKITLD